MGKRTVYLGQPVVLRVRENDPNGQPPLDIQGQPLRDRKGEPVAPFKIAEYHFNKGANLMDDAHADHPYIQSHMLDKGDAVPEFTVDQLEAMLADAKAAQAGSKVKPGGGNDSSSKGGDGGTGDAWPSDDAIQAMNSGDLGLLLQAHGIDPKPLKTTDARLNAAIDAKAKDSAAK